MKLLKCYQSYGLLVTDIVTRVIAFETYFIYWLPLPQSETIAPSPGSINLDHYTKRRVIHFRGTAPVLHHFHHIFFIYLAFPPFKCIATLRIFAHCPLRAASVPSVLNQPWIFREERGFTHHPLRNKAIHYAGALWKNHEDDCIYRE